MNRIIIGLVCGAMLLSFASAAAGAIKIVKIRYNPPGADNGSNAHLNQEWVTIRNTGNSARSLTGWKLRDSDGHSTFISVNLPAHATLKFHTGSGMDSFPHHRYWGMDNYVWNNDGDTATIRKPNGNVADRCHYSGGGSAVTC